MVVLTPSSTSLVLSYPSSSHIESGRHEGTEPAQANIIRRAWRKFASFAWPTEPQLIAMALGFVVLALTLGILTCFGLNVILTYIGGRILQYTTPNTVITAGYARIAFAGCAMVNVILLLFVPAVMLLVERRHGGNGGAFAGWTTLSLGMLVGSATAVALGIMIVPPEGESEVLGAVHALAAESLGTVVIGIPMFVVGGLYAFASGSGSGSSS